MNTNGNCMINPLQITCLKNDNGKVDLRLSTIRKQSNQNKVKKFHNVYHIQVNIALIKMIKLNNH